MKWALGILVFLACFLFLLWVLAKGQFPGLRQDREKNVTVFYPPRPEGGGVTLFLGPPVATLQTQGDSEPLLLEFTNHLPVVAHVESLRISPSDCFILDPVKEPSSPAALPEATLRPGETVVSPYRLRFKQDPKSCSGQRSLMLAFHWMGEQSQVATNEKKANGRNISHTASTLAPRSGEYALSTSPIELVTLSQRAMERMVHVIGLLAGAILIPLALGLLTWAYQVRQSKQDKRQNEEALRLDAWKAIFPDMLKNIQRHYIPISRRMDLVIEQIELHEKDPSKNLRMLYEKVLILRAQVRHLGATRGGFYFRSKPGEELCGDLLDVFWPLCRRQADASLYSDLVAKLFPRGVAIGESISLPPGSSDETDFNTLVAHFEADIAVEPMGLNRMRRLLSLLRMILNFECDSPLYPEWYDDAPEFEVDDFNFKDLPLGEDGDKIQERAGRYIKYVSKIGDKRKKEE
jgi:hypothetical protein